MIDVEFNVEGESLWDRLFLLDLIILEGGKILIPSL